MAWILVTSSALAAFAAGGASAAYTDSPPPLNLVLRFNPSEMDLGQDVSVDAWGNIVVTGISEVAGDRDIVTAKFTANGSRLWYQTIDSGDADRGEAVVTDPEGNVYVTGASKSLVGDSVVLVKYDPSGTAVWTVGFDKGTSEAARGMAIDSQGNLYVTGVSLSRNGGDGFLAKFSPEGKELWSKPINLWWHEEMFDVAVDREGNAVVVGRVLTNNTFDVIVRKFSPDGAVAWTQFVATPLREEGRGVGTDADGNVYVAGTTMFIQDNSTSTDMLLVKFSPSGSLLWTRTYDLGGDEDEGRDVVADPSGNLILTGFGIVDGSKQAAIYKLDPSGNVIWRDTWGASGIDGAGAAVVSPDGTRIVVAGASQREGADFDYLVLAYDERPPSAAFTAPGQARAGEAVTFEDASTPGRLGIASWSWDFGDGATSTDQNPSHAFEWGGTYTVRLTLRDTGNNAATRTHTLTVDGPPRPAPAAGAPDDGTGANPATGQNPTGGAPSAGNDEGGGGIPGFGAVLLVGAVAAAGLLLAAGRRRGG